MIVREVLQASIEQLKQAGVELPHLDAVLLIAHAMQIPKERVYMSFPDELDDSICGEVNVLVEKRCKGIPVSYIRNKKEFYSNEYFVDNRVLVPRPDTEILVEEAERFIKKNNSCRRVLDLCTGSGCIAITLAQIFPNIEIIASDISTKAGEVFKRNSQSILTRSLEFVESDLFGNISKTFDCIVSNPPYVTHAEVQTMQKAGWPEPVLALDGGPDGTDILFRIIDQSPGYLNEGGALFLEADPRQMKKLKHRMEKEEYINIRIISDLGKRERVITGMRS